MMQSELTKQEVLIMTIKLNKNGVIIYRGPSLIDGAEIVVIATGLTKKSANDKTGGEIQTWVIRTDVKPGLAAESGDDVSVCGNCAHRPALRRLAIAMGETPQAPCYVILFQAPRSVHACFLRGGYRDISGDADAIAEVFAGRVVRAGSYGDPAAVPAWVWIAVYRNAAGRTGYTHQWNHPIDAVRENAAALRGHVMASVETAAEYKVAKLHDWRTFRVRETADSAVFPNERVCPASKEAGFKTTCEACQACSGMLGRGHSDIVIAAH
jgi:hypothetical protein